MKINLHHLWYRNLRMSLMAFVLVLSNAQGETLTKTYTTAGEIRRLSHEAAAQKPAVHLRGTVIYKQPYQMDDLVVHDGKESIYVSCGFNPDIRVGNEIEIIGTVSPGRYAPVVAANHVILCGIGQMPPFIKTRLSELYTGFLDSQPVSLSGVVTRVTRMFDKGWAFTLKTVDGSLEILVYDDEKNETSFQSYIDSVVTVQGVCLPVFNMRSELTGVRIRVNSIQDICIDQQGEADPFLAKEIAPHALGRFSLDGKNLHRHRLKGCVSAIDAPSSFYLQTRRQGLKVKISGSVLPRVGNQLEVSGFLNERSYFTGLNHAVFRVVGEGKLPTPTRVDRQKLFQEPDHYRKIYPDFDGQIVTIKGVLRKYTPRGSQAGRLHLDCDGYLLAVHLGDVQLPDLDIGSELDVTGVCVMELSEGRPALTFPEIKDYSLILRSSADVVILKAAPWWSPGRLLLVIGGLIAGLMGILVWNLSLRKLVEKRSRQVYLENVARIEAELRVEERTRLAAELHDSVAQSLTGISMQFEAAEIAYTKAPNELPHYLKTGRQMLSSCRDEIRRCVWNLRAQVLEDNDLLPALKTITQIYDPHTHIEITLEGEAYTLSDSALHALLRITQELTANAVKHGHAQEVKIAVHFNADSVELDVSDNGVGFNTEAAPGIQKGHFGLQGIRERIKRACGEFNMTSSPGKGTVAHIRIKR
jgi:signal transduction histidine kinase